MKYSTRIKSLASFIAPFMLLVPAIASAQTVAPTTAATSTQAITIATVNIYDAQIVSQNAGTINVTFDLSNREHIQPGVRYAVQLVDAANTMADEKVYPEVVNLGENQTIPKQISYQAPSYLKGDYQLWLVARNQDGLTLAIVNPGKVTLSGDNQYVALSNCYLRVAGEAASTQYRLSQGVDIKSSEQLVAYCDATNHTSAAMTATPHFATNYRSTFGQSVDTAPVTQPAISLAKGETKKIQITLPLAKAPQAYDATLVLQDASGKAVSNQVVFHYVVHGLSATIQNLLLDKDYYAKGDIAKVSFVWSASADNFPNSRLGATDNGTMLADITIKNSNGQTCATLQKMLDQHSALVAYDMPILTDCPNPQVSSRVQDSSGTILAKSDFSIESKAIPATNYSGIAIALAALLVLIGIAFAIFKYRNKKTTTVILFLLLAGGMSLVGGTKAKADTFVTPYGLNTYTVNLNKSSYQPGEAVVATGYGSWSWCSNTYGTVAAGVTINGQYKQLFNLSKNLSLGYNGGYDHLYNVPAVCASYGQVWGGLFNRRYVTVCTSYTSPTVPGYSCYYDNNGGVSYSDTTNYVADIGQGTYTCLKPSAALLQAQAAGYTCNDFFNWEQCVLGTANGGTSIPAQTVGGSYSAVFGGCQGFQTSCSSYDSSQYIHYAIPYTVVAPVPTISLSPKNTSITLGQTLSYTVSSSGTGMTMDTVNWIAPGQGLWNWQNSSLGATVTPGNGYTSFPATSAKMTTYSFTPTKVGTYTILAGVLDQSGTRWTVTPNYTLTVVAPATPCSATTINNCTITSPSTAPGGSATGQCSGTYTGNCSYTCNVTGGNSTWGSPSSNTCAAPAASCTLPWGGTIASGQSTTAYQTSSVVSPQTCASVSQTRTCTNGTLSGSYTYPGCSVSAASCSLPWGGTIASGVSVKAFLNPTATAPATCASDPSQTRTCTNGTLSGSYTNQNCTQLNPTISSFTASPTRVQSGSSSKLSWSTTDMTSCTVKGTNGFSKTATSGTNVDSGAITAQTTFTISCNAGSPKSIVVNLVPSYSEF